MTWIDWLIFGVYLAGVVLFGVVQSRKSSGIEGYFLGGRAFAWGTIGLSVMATQASAITFIGTTGQAYDQGMEFIQIYLPQPLAMVVICVLFLPFFYRAKVYTAYEFLERRYDAKTRSLTSFLFLLSRGLATGIMMYAPAVVLSILMGWDETITILVIGGITILYTVVGGITAVVWTDVLQMLLMFAGIGVALLVLFQGLPAQVGIGDVFYIGGIHQMWRSIDWSWDPTNTYTVWSGLIGGFFLALAYFGCDQSQVQRYLTARSLTHSRLALIFNAFLKVPMQFLILAIGVLLFVFYHFERPPLIFNPAEADGLRTGAHQETYAKLEEGYQTVHAKRRSSTLDLLRMRSSGDDSSIQQARIREYNLQLGELRKRSKELVVLDRGRASSDVNYVFPGYLLHYVPTGILGLLIAVIFAAAMSSLDSELTALSSVTVVDFYQRYWAPGASERHSLVAARLATLFWGLLATGMALYAGQLGSLIVAVNLVGSYFYGSLLGVFLLAFLVKRSTARGAFWGLIAGMVSVVLFSILTEASWLYYNVVGALVVLMVGSVLGSGKHHSPRPSMIS